MTEVEKLELRFRAMQVRGILDIQVDKGPGWANATPEQRAKCINDMLDEIEAGKYEELVIGDRTILQTKMIPIVERMKSD